MRTLEIHKEYFARISRFVNQPEYNNIQENYIISSKKIGMIEKSDWQKALIQYEIINNGYILLETDLSEKENEDLLKIKTCLSFFLGKIHSEKNPKKQFYAKIQAQRDSKYYINSCATQPMHTDEGHTVQYPDYVVLYCRRQSKSGGVSILVSFDALYSELKTVFKSSLNCLFEKDVISVMNANGYESKPILLAERDDQKKVGITYSPILQKMICKENVFEMYQYITNYVHNPKKQIRFRMKEGSILVIDNKRVLHGRTAFPAIEDRLLYRLWFNRNYE